MRRSLDRKLDQLNKKLFLMGEMVCDAIEESMYSLQHADEKIAKKVIIDDQQINNLEKEIESECIKLLFTQHPVASDLRLVSAVLKMITDLSRIGDQAADICEIVICLIELGYPKKLDTLIEMGDNAIDMVKNSIQSFITGDLDLADKTIKQDDVVDALFAVNSEVIVEKIKNMEEDPKVLVDLLIINKYLERIADHAENIADWVVFSITGKHVPTHELGE